MNIAVIGALVCLMGCKTQEQRHEANMDDMANNAERQVDYQSSRIWQKHCKPGEVWQHYRDPHHCGETREQAAKASGLVRPPQDWPDTETK